MTYVRLGQAEDDVPKVISPGAPPPSTPFVTALKYITYGFIAWMAYGAVGKLTRS